MPAKTKKKAKAKTRPKKKTKAKTKTKVKAKTRVKTKTKAKVKTKAKAKTKTKTKTKTKARTMTKNKTKKQKNKYTRAEIGQFKKNILAERERILKELGRIEESINAAAEDQNGSNQSYSNHLADLGTDYMEKEKNFYYATQEGHYLRSLDEALELIERGEYGNCLDCGDLISKKRLDVVPSAKLCITCKSDREKRERGR